MSTECERAARVRAGPTRSAGTPFDRRNVLITRTTASSPGVTATPTELSRSGCVTPSASAPALMTSATPSMNTTTPRMRLFSVIRRSAAEINPEIGYLQAERSNFVQLGCDNVQFGEDADSRNLRELAGTLCDQDPGQDDRAAHDLQGGKLLAEPGVGDERPGDRLEHRGHACARRRDMPERSDEQ